MTARVHDLRSSGWLAAVTYHGGAVALLTRDGKAILHHGAPAWVVGLLVAADRRRAALGHKASTGRIYGRLLKGKYPAASSLVPEYAEQLRGIAASMQAALDADRADRDREAYGDHLVGLYEAAAHAALRDA